MSELSKKDELNHYKETVDIRHFIIDSGYKVDKERSSKKHQAFTHPATNDKVVVTVNPGEKTAKYFFNQHDKSDKGTVVDFVMSRENKSLDETRETLRSYAGNYLSTQRPTAEKLIKEPKEDPNRALRINYVVQKIAAQPINENKADEFLEQRFINQNTINHPAFKDKVKTNTYKEEKYTAFVMENAEGKPTDVVLKNHQQNKYIGDRQGVFVSEPTHHKGKVDRLIITNENPIEAMSHFQNKQLHKQPDNIVYMSTAGNPSEAQLKVVKEKVTQINPSRVTLINDNDPAGRSYDGQMRELLKDSKKPIDIEKPQFKDWNADIKAEVVYRSRLLDNTVNARTPYSTDQGYKPASKDTEKLIEENKFSQIPEANGGSKANKLYVSRTVQGKEVEFSIKDVAVINNDKKLTNYLKKEQETKTPGQGKDQSTFHLPQVPVSDGQKERIALKSDKVVAAQIASSKELPDAESKIPEKKAIISNGLQAQNEIKSEKSKIVFDPAINEETKAKDPYKAFKDLQERYNKGIDEIKAKIQGKPEHAELAKRLDYYKKYPQLDDKKISQYMKLDEKSETKSLSQNKSIEKPTIQHEVR